MFKCEKCQTNSKPGESPVRVVVKTRSKNYAERSQDRGGTGLEIAREMVVHDTCADSIRAEVELGRRNQALDQLTTLTEELGLYDAHKQQTIEGTPPNEQR